MQGRLIIPLLFGLVGCGILLGLGTWQIQRMHWKAEIIAGIEARIHQAPVPLPAAPDPDTDRYLPVTLSGRFTGEEARVLASRREAGTGVHVIAVFEATGDRRILVDRGFVPDAARDAPRPPVQAWITGNLHWPGDSDQFTPAPDLERGLWFSREVKPLAEHLATEPLLVILRQTDEAMPGARPVPLTTTDIPDNHLQYALTWFALAAVWAGMTAFLLWRIRQRRA